MSGVSSPRDMHGTHELRLHHLLETPRSRRAPILRGGARRSARAVSGRAVVSSSASFTTPRAAWRMDLEANCKPPIDKTHERENAAGAPARMRARDRRSMLVCHRGVWSATVHRTGCATAPESAPRNRRARGEQARDQHDGKRLGHGHERNHAAIEDGRHRGRALACFWARLLAARGGRRPHLRRRSTPDAAGALRGAGRSSGLHQELSQPHLAIPSAARRTCVAARARLTPAVFYTAATTGTPLCTAIGCWVRPGLRPVSPPRPFPPFSFCGGAPKFQRSLTAPQHLRRSSPYTCAARAAHPSSRPYRGSRGCCSWRRSCAAGMTRMARRWVGGSAGPARVPPLEAGGRRLKRLAARKLH